MILDPDRHKHDRSAYERPGLAFRCGRERFWAKPCRQGPNADGSCGGTRECVPFKNETGRYECRRPTLGGGPCEEGPRPDGSCSLRRPPCVPRSTLRAWRGRLALSTAGLILAFISGLLAFARGGSVPFGPVDPGPLSMKHATYTRAEGCVSCHAPQDLEPSNWVQALGRKADLSTQCIHCHAFDGPVEKAHNAVFPERKDLKDTSCVLCHREHKGADFNIATMTDAQCNTCHSVKFKSFSEGHPPFGKDFPHADRTAIQFDHQSHLSRHFRDPRWMAKVPANCLSCHAVKSVFDRDVKTGSFEKNCASCHLTDIAQKDLVVFRLPEIARNTLDRDTVLDACDPARKELEGAKGGAAERDKSASEAFASISYEMPTAASGYLLGVDTDDAEAYGEPIQSFILDLAREGNAPLARLVEARAGRPASSKLLAGLSAELVQRAACSWALNEEYEPPRSEGKGGWQADLLELRYKPAAHADPVAKDWIDFAVEAEDEAQDDLTRRGAESMRREIASRGEGAGSCTKCHAVTLEKTDEGKTKRFVEWNYHAADERPYTAFSHGVHVSFLGGGKACVRCHLVSPRADYAGSFKSEDPQHFVSNFQPIRKEICMQCHTGQSASLVKPILRRGDQKGEIRQNCLLCHVYHRHPVLKWPVSGTPASGAPASGVTTT